MSHQHRYIFLKTKKTAGSSIEMSLSRSCGPDDVITGLGATDERIRVELGGRGRQNNEGPRLVVPLRQHSGARRGLRALGPEVFWSYYRFAVVRNPWDAVVSLYHWVDRFGGGVSFGEFLHGDVVATFAVESYGTWHIHGRLAVDRVLRYENLADELAEVWTHLGLPGAPDLPRAKGGVRPAGTHYREMYDDAGRDHVGGLFSRTVDELGYTF